MRRILLLTIAGAVLLFVAIVITTDFGDPAVPLGLDPTGGGIQQIELQGRFDPTAHIVQGQPTIIEFYSDFCPGCRRLHQSYVSFLAARPDVAVRQVHLPDDWDPRAFLREHGVLIRAIPHVMVFGPDGSLLAMDTPEGFHGYEFLLGWIDAETRRW
jgi:thiol-disulfide isomerase/thioredoxin